VKPSVRGGAGTVRVLGMAAGAIFGFGRLDFLSSDPALDVLGGLNAGMQTVWVNRGGHDWQHEARPHASVTNLQQLCTLLSDAG